MPEMINLEREKFYVSSSFWRFLSIAFGPVVSQVYQSGEGTIQKLAYVTVAVKQRERLDGARVSISLQGCNPVSSQ